VMGDLPPGLYQICDACAGECDGCRVCWDLGLLPHQCGEIDDA
jgi:hypothetical protein